MKGKLSFVFIVILLLAACTPKAAPTPAGTLPPIQNPGSGGNPNEIAINNYTFVPQELTVKAGTTVKWTNQDSVGHNIVADDSSWGSALLAQGDSYSFTFTKAGTYTYHCGVHPTMVGTIIVNP
ncbi:MAG TPA: cupredoxin family copper-binding protein [Anaerolineales bacterium]|nr:cupredoxin family copper-binding protein [Anaerolineales bacterium]